MHFILKHLLYTSDIIDTTFSSWRLVCAADASGAAIGRARRGVVANARRKGKAIEAHIARIALAAHGSACLTIQVANVVNGALLGAVAGGAAESDLLADARRRIAPQRLTRAALALVRLQAVALCRANGAALQTYATGNRFEHRCGKVGAAHRVRVVRARLAAALQHLRLQRARPAILLQRVQRRRRRKIAQVCTLNLERRIRQLTVNRVSILLKKIKKRPKNEKKKK